MQTDRPNSSSSEREAFYRSLAPHSLAPLWEVLANLVTPTPSTPAVAARWRFADVRSFLMRAGELITAAEAERRVLVLENPALVGQSAITHTLYAGLQLILPGEVAPVHRHSQAALRFVMEGDGAFTTVNGVRADMHVGDLILTPGWFWHTHGNDTDQPMIWLDGLDVPLVSVLDASFSEREPAVPVSGQSDHKKRVPESADSGVLRPVRRAPVTASSKSPHFVYPYGQWRESLERMQRSAECDAHDGFRLEFMNPADGGSVMPTMSAFCQLIPKALATRALRSTDGTVHVVSEGMGSVTIGGQTFDLLQGDIFIVPSWVPRSFAAATDLVLFSFSDRAAQQKLSLWREALD